MKLLTILILLPCFCFGQKKDLSMTSNSGYPLTISSGDGWLTIGGLAPKTDTIPVLILLSDTTEQGLFRSNRDAYSGIKTNGFAMWMFGYEVTSYEENIVSLPKYSYLDQNRKPLPKSIVVWMSKTKQP